MLYSVIQKVMEQLTVARLGRMHIAHSRASVFGTACSGAIPDMYTIMQRPLSVVGQSGLSPTPLGSRILRGSQG